MSHYRTGPALPGVAFVTGGGRGLGLAIALSFAKEGARGIVLFDILPDETMASAKETVEKFLIKGGQCLTVRGSVTEEADLEAAVAKTVETFGRLDYAANFAGTYAASCLKNPNSIVTVRNLRTPCSSRGYSIG